MHYGSPSAYLKLKFKVILKRIIPFSGVDFKYGLIAHFLINFNFKTLIQMGQLKSSKNKGRISRFKN
jgi:hypothetical protein